MYSTLESVTYAAALSEVRAFELVWVAPAHVAAMTEVVPALAPQEAEDDAAQLPIRWAMELRVDPLLSATRATTLQEPFLAALAARLQTPASSQRAVAQVQSSFAEVDPPQSWDAFLAALADAPPASSRDLRESSALRALRCR